MTEETVPESAVGSSPLEQPTAEKVPQQGADDPLSKNPVLEQHLGKVGNFIGGGPEKAGNIAYIVIISSIILLIVGAICLAIADSDKAANVFDRIVTGSIALITGALGYLFGASKSS